MSEFICHARGRDLRTRFEPLWGDLRTRVEPLRGESNLRTPQLSRRRGLESTCTTVLCKYCMPWLRRCARKSKTT